LAALVVVSACGCSDAPGIGGPDGTIPEGPAGSPRAESGLQTVDLPHTRAVIFPLSEAYLDGVDAEEGWMPSAEDVRHALARVHAQLQDASTAPDRFFASPPSDVAGRAYVLGEIGKILAVFDDYSVQCVGVVIDGHRRIYCNCFLTPNPSGEPVQDWILVADGGYSFWRIQYDCVDDACVGFDSNGYA
jgi:hypothetical protein